MSSQAPPVSNQSKGQDAPGSDGSAPVPTQAPPSAVKPGQEVSQAGYVEDVQSAEYQGVPPQPGVPIMPPVYPPQPGQVVIRWDSPQPGCCQCEGLSTQGWVAAVLLCICLGPCVACIPCCLQECFEQYQRPVYGWPTDQSNEQGKAPVQQQME